MKNKKKLKQNLMRLGIILFIVIFLFSFLFQVKIFAQDNKIELIYFGTKTCFECNKEIKFIKSVTEELSKQNINIDYIFYDTTESKNNELLHNFDKAYKVPVEFTNVGGKVFIGDKYLVKLENIKANLKDIILYYHNNPNEYQKIYVDGINSGTALEKSNNILNTFTPFAVFIAGLLDGFNPCAISMLLFFITFLISTQRKNKQILFTGFSYIMGTLIAYFGIGVGLFRFGLIFKNAKSVMIGIYVITIILAVILAILNILDYIRIRSGNFMNIKTQLPQKNKHIIHNFIRSRTASKAIYISAFVSGFVISFLEFFCTGQIYLPTISYVLSSGISFSTGLFYLFIYNIAFILPLLTICFAIFKGKEVIDFSQLLVEKLSFIKLAGVIFFTLISILMIIQLFKIW